MAQACDLAQVEGLAAAVLHARPDDQSQARAVFGNRALDRLHRERAVGPVGLQFDQVGGRVEAVETHLRFERIRSEEHTSELQSLMRISYAVVCLKKKNTNIS